MKKLALAGLIVSCWCSAVVAGPGGEILADKVESPLRSRVLEQNGKTIAEKTLRP